MKRISTFLALAAAAGLLGAPLTAFARVQAAPASSKPVAASKPVASATSKQTNPSAMPASAKASTKMASATSSKKSHMKRVDLNSATSAELQAVPGISDETAEKIIAARPFKRTSELLSKKLVTKAEYSRVRYHVTVHKMTASAAK